MSLPLLLDDMANKTMLLAGVEYLSAYAAAIGEDA